jgi:hypothetical protein
MIPMRKSRYIALCAIATASVAATLASSSGEGLVDVILSNLPDRATAAYSQLYESAGRPERKLLEISKAEVWTISEGKSEALSAIAQQAGAKISKIESSGNHALVPMLNSGAMSSSQSTLMHAAMSSKAAMGAIVMSIPPDGAAEYMLTKGDLVIPIAPGKAVPAKRTSLRTIEGGYAWHGIVTETGEPVTLLWWVSGRMAGSVSYRGHMYSVHELGGGTEAVVEMDPARMPQEHAAMPAGMMDKMHLAHDPLVTKGDPSALMQNLNAIRGMPDKTEGSPTKDAKDLAAAAGAVIAPGPLDVTRVKSLPDLNGQHVVIRLIVAYTRAAAAHYDDIKSDLIPLAIEDANESFRMSGIGNVELELAYAYETDYVESGSHFEHVFRFAGKNDGYMDEVHGLRDKYKADVGVLIVDDPHGCGLSAGVHVAAERAFAVVHHECAANMYSLAHEIGHIIGARHDEALDDSKQPFSYGHGYVSGKGWRTMMAYKDSCDGCPRVPIWSSPRILIRGVPAGNDGSDNARVISENAGRVAGFR